MRKKFFQRAGTAASSIVLCVLLSTFPSYASQQELTLFDEGYEYYLSYQPEKAVESFHVFLNEFPNSSIKDAALFWLGRSFFMLQRYNEAKQIFLRLKQEFPDSPFVAYVDKELDTMEIPEVENAPSTAEEISVSEFQLMKHDREQKDNFLSELTEERDQLRRLLAEETLKKKELEAKAEKYENELGHILSRLQALQTNQTTDHHSPTVSQNQKSDLVPVPEEVKNEVISEIDVTTSVKDSDNAIEKEEQQPAAVIQEVQKDKYVVKKISPHTLELIAKEETWILVTIDDKESRERLLKPGNRIKWTAQSVFALKIGNAGGIRVLFNGKEIGPLGEKGKVVKLRLPSLNLSTSQKESSNVL